jgi:(S)-2-hydroxy-acid oxidase
MITTIKQTIGRKVIVRGIQSAFDAINAVKAGADAIWLTASTFESDPSPISILRHIKSSVSVPVWLSGGIRRGTDVLKAIALGADFLFLDYETSLWGLHLDGKEGLKKMVEMVNEELKLAMVLTYCKDVSEITEKQVVHWVSKL